MKDDRKVEVKVGRTHRSPLEGGKSPFQTSGSISRLNMENGVQMDKANRDWDEEEGERNNRLEILKPQRKKNN